MLYRQQKKYSANAFNWGSGTSPKNTEGWHSPNCVDTHQNDSQIAIRFNTSNFCSRVLPTVQRNNKIISKVLINFKTSYFYRVKRKESLRCRVFEQMGILLIWVSMHAMCMEFSDSQPLGSNSIWTQQSIWNFPSDFLRALQWASVKMSISS